MVVDRPPPDPQKLLAYWMEWERGETPPGRVMANLKIGGLRELLEAMNEPGAQDTERATRGERRGGKRRAPARRRAAHPEAAGVSSRWAAAVGGARRAPSRDRPRRFAGGVASARPGPAAAVRGGRCASGRGTGAGIRGRR